MSEVERLHMKQHDGWEPAYKEMFSLAARLEVENKRLKERLAIANHQVKMHVKTIEALREAATEPQSCPKCGSDAYRGHRDGDIQAPECYYWGCDNCHHQWGHE